MVQMDRHQLLEDLKAALARLHDVAALADSPLATALLPQAASADTTPRGVQLRNLLLDGIERLKPSTDLPETSPEWRQYLILNSRYVLHRPLWEIEHRLNIGERQVRRAHSRALAILAERLQEQVAHAEPPTAEPAATPQEAIQRLNPVSRVFNLAQLIEEVTAFLIVAGKLHENQIDAHVTPDDMHVCADPGILRQMLTRLLLTLAPWLGLERKLTLEAIGDEGLAVVRISEVAFDPNDEGLQLCQLLARVIGCELQFIRAAPDQSLAQGIQFTLIAETQLRKMLVIDDEAAAIDLFQSYMLGLNYQVAGETNPEEALKRALELQPDVIVLDVMMPAMDGWELLQRIRLEPALRDKPVVVCSVLPEADLAAALGATAFLKKPILRAQLVQVLEQLTG